MDHVVPVRFPETWSPWTEDYKLPRSNTPGKNIPFELARALPPNYLLSHFLGPLSLLKYFRVMSVVEMEDSQQTPTEHSERQRFTDS